ncbi:cell filamentation cAMP-inducing protein Fic [Tepidicaulis marinus]|uniref:Cell filamentation cAMP-inducing protein Fic n=1 Tax=Tepidicaulis marinus TaxID=1333998 RepID=A0A081BET0_9HYPH|nr:Fic family protein [Tepidicaulis marinus]GAK46548.1 cell filamentation cAMP-inducing protein Fic [Tepidicaulis marinus]
MLKPTYKIPDLPPAAELETVAVLKALAKAGRALAELKGRAATIPNQGILIDTLSLQEAKASSEIENIVTTQDELFQAELFPEGPDSPAAKEVARYRDALKLGFDRLYESGLITNKTLIDIFQLLKGHQGGFRTGPGTALKNEATGETVYVPPQEAQEIISLMAALERFIHEDEACLLDPLIKMALIHHQFESIHPFPDGNGRIGRILNVLYLTRSGLLDIPVLYLSRHITGTKGDYYRLLQAVRDEGAWEAWVLYMLEAVAETAKTTLELVEGIRGQMAAVKHRMRGELPKLYSQDLLNNLFRHPYTRIEFVMNDLHVTRQTAAKYLDTLADKGFVEKHQAGRSNYYINTALVRLFLDVSGGR